MQKRRSMKTALTVLTLVFLCGVTADVVHAQAPKARTTRLAKARVQVKAVGKRLGQRLVRAGKRLGSAAKRIDRATGFKKLRRRIGTRISLASAYGTELADKLQAKLPGKLGRGFGKLRLFSISTAGAFAAKKFKQDAGFLATFGVASPTLMHAAVPFAIAAGANPVLVGVGHEIIEIPINLGVIAWRQHHLAKRANPNQTFRQTLRQLGGEYSATAKEGRVRNHRRLSLHRHFKAKRAAQKRARNVSAQQGSLQALGAQL
jgi:hypothetical protein